MNIHALQKRLRDFAAARGWEKLHAPKNLAMALMVEAGELLELFQWLTTAESHALTKSSADKERVGDEIADVLFYLLHLADHTGVNLEEAVERKLLKNAEKHPAKHPEKPAQKSKVHLFVDWENVQPKGDELHALAPGGTDVWLFHGPAQKVDVSSHRLTYGSGEITLVPRSGSGKNALDFQLSYYIGYVASRNPDAQFVVVSNDIGYDPMLAHARELGFDARRCEFRRPPSKPAIPSKPDPLAKPTAKSTKAGRRDAPLQLAAPAPTEPTAAHIAWRAIVQLRQMPSRSRPDNTQALLESLIHEPVADKALLARRATQLLEIRSAGHFVAKDTLQAAPLPMPAPVPACASVPVAPARQQALAPATKAPVEKAAPKKTPLPAAQVVQRVLTSLKKMPNNKPTRKAGLLKHIETHLGTAPDRAVRAHEVLTLLKSKKQVALSADGLRVSYPHLK
ncbi:MAG: hypothetical protein EOO27_31085 [Comamonadaceae bacterium]|nr:MAG: hypothetical protein EOO27_31085 [Comamonadaceae bacterium]